MASNTYRLALTKASGAVQNIDFTIPDTAGTYNLKLNLGDGATIDAGNITVGNTKNTYKLALVKGSGATIDAGTFTTPMLPYTLSISQGSNTTVTVNRTSSPNAGAATGALTNGAAIYDGDVLKITFTASSGYNVSTHTVNGATFTSDGSYTVTSNVSVVSTAVAAGSWHTIWSGTKTISFSASESNNQTYKTAGISISNYPTRITGTIYPQTTNTNFPTTSYSAEELDTSSSRITYNVETVGSGNRRTDYWEELYAYRTTSAIMLRCDMYTYYPSTGRKLCIASTVKITKVEQFY